MLIQLPSNNLRGAVLRRRLFDPSTKTYASNELRAQVPAPIFGRNVLLALFLGTLARNLKGFVYFVRNRSQRYRAYLANVEPTLIFQWIRQSYRRQEYQCKFMTDAEFKEVKELWKLTYAHKGIEQAMDCIKFILENKIHRTNPIFDPLLVSIYTLYCRPFSKNTLVGSLDSRYIPKEWKIFHGHLIDFRNELFAHSDAIANKTAQHGPLLQVVGVFETQKFPEMVTTSLQLQNGHFIVMMRYFVTLHKILHGEMVLKWDKFCYPPYRPPQDGEYVLNIYEQSKDIWITKEEAIKLCPPDSTLINVVAPPE